MSGGRGFGSTLTSGVQDISALLPLLGTEQCEDHVGSALTQGYLYAAASPISLFGSLGIARAGFKSLMSATQISTPWLKIDGAKLLANAGFRPRGMNLSLIMLDEERKSYGAENQIDSMIKDLHIEDSNRITVVAKNSWWNVQMIVSTALSCAISVTPYIHLNLQEPNSLNHFVRWVFPVLRAIGGFLTVTTMQLVLQMRLLAIVRKWLILKGLRDEELESLGIKVTDEKSFWACHPALDQRCLLVEQQVRHTLNHPPNPTACLAQLLSSFGLLVRRIFSQCSPGSSNMVPAGDAENASPPASPNNNPCNNELPNKKWQHLEKQITEANGSSLSMCMLLVLLLVGVAFSVAGYIGCFSAVQGSRSSREALIWLGLEVGLSIIRMIIWGLNPKGDDAPPLEFKFQLDEHPPLPTCTHTAEEIVKQKSLPLVRAEEFLHSITSYAGLLKQFSHPLLTLYYTLTWKHHLAMDKKNERILFITIFDHAERTTRVYTESDLVFGPNENSKDDWISVAGDSSIVRSDFKPSYFSSAGPLTIDLEHNILKASLGSRIYNDDDDPIAMNNTLHTELAKHYHSILGRVNRSAGPVYDTFKDDWRLKFRGTSKMQCESGHKGAEGAQVYRSRDHVFLEKGQLERTLKKLFHAQGKWIERYMKWSSDDMDSKSSGIKALYSIQTGNELNKLKDVIQLLLQSEHLIMEQLHVYEVHRWEEMLWEKFQDMIDDNCPREIVVKRWKAGLGERLEAEQQAMLARISTLSKNYLLEGIDHSWQSLFKKLTSWQAVSISTQWNTNLRLRQYDYKMRVYGHGRAWIGARVEETQRRLDSELEEIEERLSQGFEHCDQFQTLNIKHRHSDSKWQYLFPMDNITALKRNPHVCHISLSISNIHDLTTLCEALPQCTSIFVESFDDISTHIPLPSNILSISGNVTIPQSTQDICVQNRLKETRTTFEFANMRSWPSNSSLLGNSSATFTIRFHGPSSGLLTLQLTHTARESDQILHIEMNGSPSDHPVPHIETFEEIQIHSASAPDLSKSALIFIPEHRNILTCFPPEGYQLSALELVKLVDESWQPYQVRVAGCTGGNNEKFEEASNKVIGKGKRQ